MGSLVESQVPAFHSARQRAADHFIASGRLLMGDQYFNGSDVREFIIRNLWRTEAGIDQIGVCGIKIRKF
jgi:hypothetical protein